MPANLEEALIGDDLECIDLKLLLQSYVNNCKMMQPGRVFTLNAPEEPLFAWICDYRIEQLLDKLIDNAIDFSEVGSTICVDLKARRHRPKPRHHECRPWNSREFAHQYF